MLASALTEVSIARRPWVMWLACLVSESLCFSSLITDYTGTNSDKRNI